MGPRVVFSCPNNSRLIPGSRTYDFSNEPKQIRIVDTESQCIAALNGLIRFTRKSRNQGNRLIGMDCEWVAFRGDRNPVALLQLATTCGYCVLIRLVKFNTISSYLAKILSDETIKKVGVEIKKDVDYLCEDYDIQCNGVLDLRYMQNISKIKIQTPSGKPPMGLESMGRTYLGLRSYKSNNVSWSNWEADELTYEQIEYAAMDAYVSAMLGNFFLNGYS